MSSRGPVVDDLNSRRYGGCKAIAARLGCGQRTVHRWIDQLGLPAYRRPKGHHVYLYTEEALILRWQMAMAQDFRQRRVAGRHIPQPNNRLVSPNRRTAYLASIQQSAQAVSG
jgi:hypothetical protein